jgi:DnaJ-class molecular chaperone
VNSLRGDVRCNGCNGAGGFKNVDCPKCKAKGTTVCKARGCDKAVKPPTFESFADAYTCRTCAGKGGLMKHVAWPCADCAGVGLVLQPKADPTKLLK